MHELNAGIDHVRDLTDPEKGTIDVSLIYAISNICFPRLLQGYLEKQLPNQATSNSARATRPPS